jgi:predicted phage terminase large subunit-like protein
LPKFAPDDLLRLEEEALERELLLQLELQMREISTRKIEHEVADLAPPEPMQPIKLPAPFPGKQTKFLECEADIVIYGGAAGGGKSYGLLLDAARYANVTGYVATIFRRTLAQVKQQGGIWEKSAPLYATTGAVSNSSLHRWMWTDSHATVGFAGLEMEDSKYNYQGAEFAYLGFDEGTHFSKGQVIYLISRARTTCGVKPRIRLTVNPDPDSWVCDFIAWWIDQDTGYAISERDGVIRWVITHNDQFAWFDTKKQAVKFLEERGIKDAEKLPKSATFILSMLEDNPVLDATDYRANLMLQGSVDQERLLKGNWKIRPAAGLVFPRDKIRIVDVAPSPRVRTTRFWDFGGTSDYTASLKMSLLEDGRFLIEDASNDISSSLTNDQLLMNKARADGAGVRVGIPQDPAEAGKTLAKNRVSSLAGYDVVVHRPSANKVVRSAPFAAQWQAENVLMLHADWNPVVLNQYDGFPDGKFDDLVDAGADAFNDLTKHKPHRPGSRVS